MQSGRADCEALARAARRRIAEDYGMNGNADDGDEIDTSAPGSRASGR